jgi:hypothetical protein
LTAEGIYHIVNTIVGKKLHLVDKECEIYTISLMDKLEQMKGAHSGEDVFNDEIAAKAYVEQFALETFQRADNVLQANKVTAYVSCFLCPFVVQLQYHIACSLNQLFLLF